jgi:hypothetical protein
MGHDSEAIVATVKDRSLKRVVICDRLSNAPSIRLSPGQSFCGPVHLNRPDFLVS